MLTNLFRAISNRHYARKLLAEAWKLERSGNKDKAILICKKIIHKDLASDINRASFGFLQRALGLEILSDVPKQSVDSEYKLKR